MIREDADSIQARYGWDDHVMMYPAGDGYCPACDEPHRPLVAVYPDVVDFERHERTLCLDCLTEHPETWSLLGEVLLEGMDVDDWVCEPGYMADVVYVCPDTWEHIPSPRYEPWAEVRLVYDSSKGEVAASRSPWETKTIPTANISGPETLVVNGNEYDYTGYAPGVNVDSWEESVSERLNEPPEPDIHAHKYDL